MIEIYRYEPAWEVNASPFCLKVETYCQLAAIPYSVAFIQPINGPRGLLPFIVDEGKTISDSGQIIQYLKAKYGDILDANLSASAHATGHLLRQLCEQSLYFAMLYSRWQDNDYWPNVQKAVFGNIPRITRDLTSVMTRRKMVTALHHHGYGRFSREEVYAHATHDLSFIATQLSQQPFAVGHHVSSYDATLYAFLFNIIRVPLHTPLHQHAHSLGVLNDYMRRIEEVILLKASYQL